MNGKFKIFVLSSLVLIVALGVAGVALANDQSVQIIGICGAVSTPLMILLLKLVENELAKQLEERNKEMRDALVKKLDTAEDKAGEAKVQVLAKVQEVKTAITEAALPTAPQEVVITNPIVAVRETPPGEK